MAVERNFHLDLLRAQLAAAEGMLFVYKFNGDDWFGGVERYSFANAEINVKTSLYCKERGAYNAYAPVPIVRDTRRNGRFDGRGAA
jgi:hypothetical protein